MDEIIYQYFCIYYEKFKYLFDKIKMIPFEDYEVILVE